MKLLHNLCGFWCSKSQPTPICFFRILYGVLVLISSLLLAPNLMAFFGAKAIISVPTMQLYEGNPRFSLLFFFPSSDWFVLLLYTLLLISAIFVTVGLFTRTSLILLFISLLSFHHRNLAILNSGDTLLRIMGFLLIFSPAGKFFSIDHFLASKLSAGQAVTREVETSIWPQRLLQIQVAAVYCHAFFSKIYTQDWLNGSAIYYASRLEEFQRFSVPYVLDHLWTCQLLTWSTLMIELSLFTLVWWKPIRNYVLIAGVALHLGIDWCMNIPLFEYVMIACYVNFLEPSDLDRLFHSGKWLMRTSVQFLKFAVVKFRNSILFER